MGKKNFSERELLLRIEKQPELFLEKVSYNRMISFLNGYQMGRIKYDWYYSSLKHAYPHLPFNLFGAYVFLYLNAPSNTARGWSSMIAYRNEQDEVKSWSAFFEIFHSFDKLIIEGVQTYKVSSAQLEFKDKESSYQLDFQRREGAENQDITLNIHKISHDYGCFATIHNEQCATILDERVGSVHREIFSTLDECEARVRQNFGPTVSLKAFN